MWGCSGILNFLKSLFKGTGSQASLTIYGRRIRYSIKKANLQMQQWAWVRLNHQKRQGTELTGNNQADEIHRLTFVHHYTYV